MQTIIGAEGGEITWECQSDGRYVFHLNLYQRCATPYFYSSSIRFIQITGSSLPTNAVTSILVRFDTAAYNANPLGALARFCSSPNANQASCRNGDTAFRFAPFISDTIQLTGIPPSSGWSFSFDILCCTGPMANVISQQQFLIQSTMYGFPNRAVDTCYSSSAQFFEYPNTQFTLNDTNEFNITAYSSMGDSLSYANVRTLRGITPSSSQAVPFNPGFSLSNITPSTLANSNNMPYAINSINGDVKFAIYDSLSRGDIYSTNTRINTYRNGSRLSSVDRLVPIFVGPSDTLSNGTQNTAPVMLAPFVVNGQPSFSTTVMVSDTIEPFLDFLDIDITGVGNGFQEITIVPLGENFSLDLMNASNCIDPADSSCATFTFAPVLDNNIVPAKLVYKTFRTGFLTFRWITDRSDLSASGQAKTHYFTFKVFDDHCPIPKTIYKTISITVLPIVTDIEELEFNTKTISYFPNPTNGLVNISLKNKVKNLLVEIRNVQGQLVQKQQFTNQSNLELDIKGKAGIYFVQLTNEKGERANLKVLKQ